MATSIGLIGLGNMGKAVLKCLQRSGISEITVCVSSPDKIGPAQRLFPGLHWTSSAVDIAQQCQTILLCVKPGVALPICQQMGPHLKENSVLISMVGALRHSEMVKATGRGTVIRTMPNLPIAFHTGIIGIYPADKLSLTHESLMKTLFGSNRLVSIPSDKEMLMDSITALSGCGPAFLCEILSSFISSGQKMGLDHETSTWLVLSTLRGTLEMIESRVGSEPDVLSTIPREVASKGGATEKGLLLLTEGTLTRILEETHIVARNRMDEVGKALKHE